VGILEAVARVDIGDWITSIAAATGALTGTLAFIWNIVRWWRGRKPLDVQAFMETVPYGYIANTSGHPVYIVGACFADRKTREQHWVGSDKLPPGGLLDPFARTPVSVPWTAGKPFEGFLWVQDGQDRVYRAKARKPGPPKVFKPPWWRLRGR
jgi:hypothetical protein